jgi:hypothetical protein
MKRKEMKLKREEPNRVAARLAVPKLHRSSPTKGNKIENQPKLKAPGC